MNANIEHINNFIQHTTHFFGMTWHKDCCICSEDAGIIKTFCAREALDKQTDEMYLSVDNSMPIDDFNLANAYRYAMYIYENPDECPDWENRISATALFSNNREAFLDCARLIVDHHVILNNIDYLHPDTVLPEDMHLNITAVTCDGENVLQFYNCPTKKSIENVCDMISENIDEHTM